MGSITHGHELWKAIWGVNQLLKVKHYMWRLASNVVAVKMNIRRRGMLVDPGCPTCGEDETREHMVVDYSYTAPVWADLTGTRDSDANTLDITTWLDDRRRGRGGMDQQRQQNWEVCMMTAWRIWKARC